MSHFGKTIDENEDISIGHVYEDARRERIDVIHRNIALSALRNWEWSQLFLSFLARRFRPGTHMAIADETLNIFIGYRLGYHHF